MNIVILCLLHFFVASAQEDLPIISHSQIADGRQGLEKGFLSGYETAYGYTVSVGDVIAVNVPTGSAAQVTALSGSAYSSRVGVTATTGTSVGRSYFKFIFNGTYAATVSKMLLLGAADPTLYQAPGTLSGSEMKVIRIKLDGTNKRPVVWMECELINSREKANLSGVITISDYDMAMNAGEIYNPAHITRDIAIQRIREAKELFDLGLISGEEFEATKVKYAPYI
jgi:hypothetical protein